MKVKTYTSNHNINLLMQIDNNGGQFTAKEASWLAEKEYGNVFKTKKDLLDYYWKNNRIKLNSLIVFLDFIVTNKCKNILSLGAGECVMENFLKVNLPEEIKIIATDFNSFFIKRAKEFFPKLISEEFDFFKDDIKSFQKKLNIKFDCAVFFGSAYIMDDYDFIRLFNDLKKVGVKYIFDFQPGFIDEDAAGPKLSTTKYNGKCHGFLRSWSELKSLYKKANLKLALELSLPDYKYVAICTTI
uniref:Putative methyltransferase n=1 Tax=viral metagenome TaxID=1070528 RepID=A0A6M3JZL7_9ZZZZ